MCSEGMPWPFFIPEFLKRRACRYLLHHYLGQYLGGKINLDDLSIDLYNGTGSINNVPINIEAVNEVLDDISAPVHVVSGYIGCVSVSIPWSSLMRDSCTVELSGLSLTVTPSGTHYGSQGSMTDSLFFSMSTSHQLAEEVLKNTPEEEEEEEDEKKGGFEGMEALAKAIETVLLKVQIKLLDTTISICHQTKDKWNNLNFRINRIEFFDEMAKIKETATPCQSEEKEDDTLLLEQKEYATKIFNLSGFKIDLSSSSNSTKDIADSLFSTDSVGVNGVPYGTPIASGDGDITVTVKMRQLDDTTSDRPKLDIEMIVGAIHVLLCPKELHQMIELVTDVSNKVRQSIPSSTNQKAGGTAPGQNRPIPHQAMRTIETQLVAHMETQRKLKQIERENQQLDPWEINKKLSTHCVSTATSNDVFYSFDLNSDDTSTTPGATIYDQHELRSPLLTNVPFSDGVGLQQLSSPKGFRHNQPKHNEGELIHYSLVIGGVTLTLLETNPIHTYHTTSNKTSLQDSELFSSVRSHLSHEEEEEEYCSMDQGGLDPIKYFESVSDILHGRVSKSDIMRHHEHLGRVLPADHLFLWMSTVKTTVTTEASTVNINSSIASAEVLEFLYHNEANIPDIKPVSVQPLIQLLEDSKNAKPCIKMNTSIATTESESAIITEVHLLQVQVYLDVTLLDRLHPLLHLPHDTNLLHGLGFNAGPTNFQNQIPPQALFTHAMATGSTPNEEQKISVKIHSKFIGLTLRFPVADLSQSIRPPWYRPPLRTEVLFIDLTDLSFSYLTPSLKSTSTTLHTNTVKVYMSMDGSEESKELFLVIGNETESNNELNKTSVRFTINHHEESPLDEQPLTTSFSEGEDEEFDIKVPLNKPSIFSQKKEYFSGPGKSHSELLEEHIIPSSHEEMISFESHIMTTSKYTLSISIPNISLHIPNKLFLETLYNRFTTDLALWEPATPADVERATARSLFYSNIDMLQPAITKDDKFKLCRSVLREDSGESLSQEESDDSTQGHTISSPTFLSFSINVHKGSISIALPVKVKCDEEEDSSLSNSTTLSYNKEEEVTDPRLLDLSPQRTHTQSSLPLQLGLLSIEFRDGFLCVAVDYNGETGSNQLCMNANTITVKHCSRTSSISFIHHSLLMIDYDSLPFHDILNTWHSEDNSGCGLLERSEPMISVAVETKTEFDANRKLHKCALKVFGALFDFHVTSLEDSFIKQIGDLLTLKDAHVPGYHPPTVITELHTSLSHSAIQYRPLFIPTHAVIRIESIRMASTLVTGSPLLVVKVLVDDMSLFLSDKQNSPLLLFKNDFVEVMTLGSFEFILRLCNKIDSTAAELLSTIPTVDFQCFGSEIIFMMCIDSCVLLRDLLLYLAESKDLNEKPPILLSEHNAKTCPGIEETLVNDSIGGDTVLETVGDLISEAMEDDDTHQCNDETRESLVISKSKGTTTFIFSSDSEEEKDEMRPSVKKETVSNKLLTDDWVIDEDDYCILSTPTTAKVGPSSAPVVKCLLYEMDQFDVIDNYFAVPDHVVDQLKRPKGFPNPDMMYSLRELTIIWQLYGGRDFSLPSGGVSSPSLSLKSSTKTKNKDHESKNGSSSNRRRRTVGGVGRDYNKLVEIEISKLRLQHETYPPDAHESSRFVFLIHDIEIRDRLSQSLINKFLYQYSTESLPRQSHSNMFSLKILFTHPDGVKESLPHTHTIPPSLLGLEASAKLSLLPIRLNIDQDTFLFLHDYFNLLIPQSSDEEFPNTTVTNTAIATTNITATTTTAVTVNSTAGNDTTAEGQRGGGINPYTRVFIKSFVFHPDVPIRIDYEAKRLLSDQLGTFAGILLGLSHLDNSEVTLKSISYKQGILGWDQLIEQVTNEWIQDIGSYQLPRILKGVGPMYHVTQLFQGVIDLVWLPVQQYQEDGRIVWGLQRGTNSFASSSGLAIVELTNRFLYSIQSLAQTGFDMVSPGGGPVDGMPSGAVADPHQSADLREGFVNAYNIVTTGLGDTAWDLYQAASTEHTDHGVTGAVGGVLRHLPGNIFRPIIYASQATRHVLGGAKNQFVPEAKKEATEKWKNNT